MMNTCCRFRFVTRKFPFLRQWAGISNRKTSPRVCVMGCGVAGLQTVRSLTERGIPVTAFDSASRVGGVWIENYEGFGLQVMKQLYEFPDFPHKKVRWGSYPTGEQIHQYIEDFTDHFNLRDNLQLNTTVSSVKRSGEGWTVTTVPVGGGDSKTHEFDFLTVCTGMYGTKKEPPFTEGIDTYQGELIHGVDFTNKDIAKDKNVVVIGGGKTAVDVAIAASKSPAKSVTMLQRKPHWPTPRMIAGVIPFQYVVSSRFGGALVAGESAPLPDSSLPIRLFCKISKPITKPIFKLLEILFAYQLGLKGDFRPKSGIVPDLYQCAYLINTELKQNVAAGTISSKKGEVSSLCKDGIVLKDGDKLDSNLIIYATGYRKRYSYFEDEIVKSLGIEEDGLYLYRFMLPKNVNNLAFVGSEIGTLYNVLTSGLQAEWLARHIAAGSLPSEQVISNGIEALKHWARSFIPNHPSRANQVLLHQTHYHDILLRDMHVSPKRKYPNIIAESLLPYQCADYNGIVGK